MNPKKRPSLNRVFKILLNRYGPQGWWPGDTPFEISLGAILTQNVAWINVEKAIKQLKEHELLSPGSLAQRTDQEIAVLIRSTGYYNQKVKKLRHFLEWFRDYASDFRRVAAIETAPLRKQLLSVKGIGPETVDSILLYALERRIFVVDAYTRRIFERLGILKGGETYESVQEVFHIKFRGDVQDYNEYHALIVRHGKDVCRKKPLCISCCLAKLCPLEKETPAAVHPNRDISGCPL